MIARDTEVKTTNDSAEKKGSKRSLPAMLLPQSSVRLMPPVGNTKLIVCDAYVAFVVKSITNLALAEGSFILNYTMVCYVDPTGLTPRMLEFVATRMKFRMDDQAGEPMDDPMLGEWMKGDQPLLKFTVRRSGSVMIPVQQQLNAVRNFPFDKFELQISFELESVWVPEDKENPNEHAVRVRFNVHHPKNIRHGFHGGLRSKEVVDRLPEYQIDFANRECWGAKATKEGAQPVIVYGVEVARISHNIVWTTFFPMFATQALLVLLHTVEENISIGDMATIMLALFAFLTAARDKIPVFPLASVLDKMVFMFVLQLIFVCIDLLYEYFFPEYSAQNRPVFLIISTSGFALQLLYVAFRWCRSGLSNGGGPSTLEQGPDTRQTAFKEEEWVKATERTSKPAGA